MTGLEALRDLPVRIGGGRFAAVDSRNATMLYGTDHGSGVGLVTTEH